MYQEGWLNKDDVSNRIWMFLAEQVHRVLHKVFPTETSVTGLFGLLAYLALY